MSTECIDLLAGSCTACVLVLNDAQLTATNLGDSGYLILRGPKVVYKSAQQQHDFNFPYQMGHPGSNSDTPSDAQVRCHITHRMTSAPDVSQRTCCLRLNTGVRFPTEPSTFMTCFGDLRRQRSGMLLMPYSHILSAILRMFD